MRTDVSSPRSQKPPTKPAANDMNPVQIHTSASLTSHLFFHSQVVSAFQVFRLKCLKHCLHLQGWSPKDEGSVFLQNVATPQVRISLQHRRKKDRQRTNVCIKSVLVPGDARTEY
jgi:hypothetical protein